LAEALRTPPHSLEAEQSVLGGLLLDNATWDVVSDRVSRNDFYQPQNCLVFDAIAELAAEAKPIDAVTLKDKLESGDHLESIGGLPYIAALVNGTPAVSNIAHYADIVRERSILRQLSKAANGIGNMAMNMEGESVPEILDRAESLIFEIADQGAKSRTGFQKPPELIQKIIAHIEKVGESERAITGLATGFIDLDDMTSGLQPSDLVIVAGRPSMGKTSFAMNLVENVALHEKRPVAVFSMEMPGEQLLMRMLASLSKVSSQKIRNAQLREEDWNSMISTSNLLNNAPIFIDDSAGLTPSDIRARVRRLKREEGDLGLIVLDYIQLMRPGGNIDANNRVLVISEISRNLKALAKEMDVPVIALSQLSRAVESRSDKRPLMSDLRESGAIEQDADVIMFIYRDEVYDENSAEKGIAEIIIGKHRNGPTGTVRLAFIGEFTRFDNLAPEYYEQGMG
jgi:replicative DNA helicase